MKTVLERASAYLEKMQPAIAGSGGDIATFQAASALTRGFALSVEDALPLLLDWNQTHCFPPWHDAELRCKLQSAARSSSPFGRLLDTSNSFWPNQIPSRPGESAQKAKQREGWPAFTDATLAEIEAISRLRHIPGSAIRAAADAGLLRTCHYQNTGCFILTEDCFAQARRLDGKPLLISGGVSKAKNLSGSVGAFIGSTLLDECARVLLVEGCVGMLEALGCISLADTQGWTVIAATSAGSRFSRAPETLAKLKGRHVRIVPDQDEAGLNAASIWLAELEKTGASVDAVRLPPGCKDLGSVTSDPLGHQSFLNTLFQ